MKSLLKQKNKISIVQKPRKKYDIADVFEKKRRLDVSSDAKGAKPS